MSAVNNGEKVPRRLLRWVLRREQEKRTVAARKERYGLDVTGDAIAVHEARRAMRNARKRERRK